MIVSNSSSSSPSIRSLSVTQARSVGIETDVHFMTNVINAATQNSRWLMAVQLLQLMRGYGLSPNEITYTSILSRMSKAKQVKRDMEYGASSMERAILRPFCSSWEFVVTPLARLASLWLSENPGGVSWW